MYDYEKRKSEEKDIFNLNLNFKAAEMTFFYSKNIIFLRNENFIRPLS